MSKYPKCPKCEKIFTPDEKVSWKCSSCGSVFSCSLFKLIQKRDDKNQIESISNLKQKISNQNEQMKKAKILSLVLICILTVSLISSGVGAYYYNNEINSLQTDLLSATNKCNSLLDEEKVLKNNNAELSSENDQYKINLSSYKNKISKYKTKISSLKSDISKIEKYRDTYKDLEAKYNNLSSKYNELDLKYDGLSSEYASLETANANLQTQIKEYQSSISASYSGSGYNSSSSVTSYTVYVTRTGDKYHSSGCRYLSRSQIPVDKNDAISQGYTACSVCQP